MSCTPKCTVPGCPLDHGPVCKDGVVCPTRNTCQLYHQPRNRQRLQATDTPFYPTSQRPPEQQQQNAIKPTPAPLQPERTPFQPQAQLNPAAVPFTPLPMNHRPHLNAQVQDPTIEYTDDDEDFFSEEDFIDEDDEFGDIVTSVQRRFPHFNEQEVEAYANEIFYSQRHGGPTPSQPSFNNQFQQPQQSQQQQQQQHTSRKSTQQVQQSTAHNQQSIACQCCGGEPLNCEGSALCLTRGICICVDDEVDNAKLDTWVPLSYSCPCCKGFIYRCAKQSPGCTTQCDCATCRAQ